MDPPDLAFENSLWEKGYRKVAGVDEVGRGSWAGPLVVGAVILKKNFVIPLGFADSKKIRPNMRKEFTKYIKRHSLYWAIAEISVSQINKFGLGKATHMAFRKAVRSLAVKPDFLLVDSFYVKQVNRKNQKAIKKGDEKSASIAAASIIAKVYRDSLMKKLSKKYPKYHFAKHKGYGTREHQQAIKQYGFTKIHRQSFNLSYLHSFAKEIRI